MWMSMLKSEITGKHSKKRKNQQLTENHKMLKTEI